MDNREVSRNESLIDAFSRENVVSKLATENRSPDLRLAP
jgi:hypothetical protein